MDRLKKSAGLKCAAAIVFVVSVLAFIISGIIGFFFFDKGVYNENGTQKIYDDCIQDITMGYEMEAINYFEEKASANIAKSYSLNSYNGNLDNYYYRFMEGNTNFYFDITPTEKDDIEKYSALTNINGDLDYCYETENVNIATASVSEIFKYDISVDDIKEKGTLLDDSYYDFDIAESSQYYYVDSYDIEYSNVYKYENNPGYIITNDYIRYDLLKDNDFVKKWKSFCRRYGDEAAITMGDAVYDYIEGVFKATVYISYDIPIHIKEYVASEFTAHDEYYNSVILSNYNLIKSVSEAVLPVLVISAVFMIITFGYLIASAGYRKNCDTITLNKIDRIPYDIMLFVFVCECYFWAKSILYILNSGYNGLWTFGEMLICVAGAIGGLIYLPVFIMTTATRFKCHVSVSQNTVIWKSIRLICRVLKLIITNLNLYWKYLGILCLAAFIEFYAMASGNMSEAVFIGLVIFVLLLFIMIKAIINMDALKKGANELAKGNTDYEIDTNGMMWEFKQHGENLNRIKDGMQLAVDERMKSERMKTELITNVSHDIKTPLTSIISYVDLLEKENIDNATAREYIDVLERQADRLKKLIQDLIDASKASTGNLAVNIEQVDLKVLLEQAMGEFADKLEERGLKPIITYSTEAGMVMADGQHLWRIIQNLINNITKYAQDNTRIYIDVDSATYDDMTASGVFSHKGMLKVVFKNISKDELNVTGDELMERFVRGDSSRNTEGSGLGLSIAEGLARLQGGNLEIIVDGDLFKVVLLLVRA